MKQVILCVETNKQANTDVGYIDAVIKKLYQIGTEIKLQYKYFNGKGGYNAPKLLKEIKKDIAALKGQSSHLKSYIALIRINMIRMLKCKN